MLTLAPQSRLTQRGRLDRYVSCCAIALFSILLLSFSPPTVPKPSNFNARLINLEGTTRETFRYNATLYNGKGRPVVFEFQSAAPAGWTVTFRIEGMQVAGFRLDSNKTQNLTVEVSPSPNAKPGKYPIPVTARSDEESLRLDLEAVIKGSHSIELTTPDGRLSDEITEGKRKPIQLVVKNTGTLPLDKLELSAQTPPKWSAVFEPSTIERLDAGQSVNVTATLDVPNKTIAGDYVTNFTVKNNNINGNASFRMTVTTSWLAGWLGMLIILLAVGIIYYLIRKYGRR